MSIFLTPSDNVFKQQVSDGYENLLTRTNGLSTNSLSFATISQVDILPNIFSNDRNNSRIEIDWLGRLIGAAGSKQFRLLFDATTVFTTTTFTNTFTEHHSKAIVVFRNGQMLVYFRVIGSPTGTGTTQNNAGMLPFTNADPTITHSLFLQALVTNAADSVTVEWTGGAYR